MARITGKTVSPLFAWFYENLASHWTSDRFSRYRRNILRDKFASFGPRSAVSFDVRLLDVHRIEVGANTRLNNKSVFDGRGGLTIGSDCLIGFESIILTTLHRTDRMDIPIATQGFDTSPVMIGDDVLTGCRVVILAGVTIGNGAVIGANSVVTQDVPAYAVVGGVPARSIRSRAPVVDHAAGPPNP